MVALIHAYSRRNAGDGLLVDLSLERLERAGVRRADCEVFALDAASFDDLPRVHQIGVPGRRPSPAMLPAAGQLAASALYVGSRRRLKLGQLPDVLARADAIFAVGGGYLRTGTTVASFGTLLNHVPQLGAASRATVPTVYLPQSIGPLRGPVGALVRRLLKRIDLVCVRDDRSVDELGPRLPVHRFPDLAVLRLSEQLGQANGKTSSGDRILLVGRELTNGRPYEQRLVELAGRLGDVTWAAQAEGLGSKSDVSLYERLGVRSEGRLLDLLEQSSPAVVVSTRLHGAVQSLLAGVPAVHLGYERKSWSAYGDLGLSDYVHNARSFDPAAVAAQARGLASDPAAFWKLIEERRPALAESSQRLDAVIAEHLSAAS